MKKSVSLDSEEIILMYRKMLTIRHFEERVAELYTEGLIPGVAHLYIGEEAVAVGVCKALSESDYVLSTHRGHGHSIAKGMELGKLMSELFGKVAGCCKGIGGSMHSTDPERGILFSTAIVGGGIPIAVGVGLSIKMRGAKEVAACFFGDGAVNIGSFHESLNLASLWKLPVVFVCENNLYAISVSVKKSTSAKNIADRAVAYDIPGIIVDGNDVIAVYDAASKAIDRARRGEGPTLIECRTYRWLGHHIRDPGTAYRTKEEIEEWKRRCPIKRLQAVIGEKGLLTEKEMDQIERKVREEIEAAVEMAKGSDYPSPESLEKLVFSATNPGSDP